MTPVKKSSLVVSIEELNQKLQQSSNTHYYSKGNIRIHPKWWATLYQDRTYRSIAFDDITDDLSIHTIWEGIDSRSNKDEGQAAIFEIRVEAKDRMWKWETSSFELAGTLHAIILQQLRDGISPGDIVVNNPFN